MMRVRRNNVFIRQFLKTCKQPVGYDPDARLVELGTDIDSEKLKNDA